MNTIHQYVRRVEPGEAVTEAVLQRGRMLRGLGFQSETYAQEIPRQLSRLVRPAQSYAHSHEVPLVFQTTDDPHGETLPLAGSRVVLTTSALDSGLNSGAEAMARLLAWEALLGPRVAAVVIEDPARDSSAVQPGWHVSPPLFGSRASRRSTILPSVPLGRPFVLVASGRDPSVAFCNDVAAAMDRPVDFALLESETDATSELPGGGRLRQFASLHPAALAGLFRRADVLLWPQASMHGCLHALTALSFELPVLAADSASAQRLVLPGRGLLGAWTTADVAHALREILGDRELHRQLARDQAARRATLERDAGGALEHVARRLGFRSQRLSLPSLPVPPIVIEGSFETSYSLDVTNRGLARGLQRQRPGQVALSASHGKGDYWPKMDDLARHPDLVPLWRRHRRSQEPDVLIRGMYPPRVADMRGRQKLLYFAWEESNLPEDWVAEFNRCLDGLVVVSRFVRKVLIDAGVRVPIGVIGNGVDQIREVARERLEHPLPSGFKFLHVSSAFPRKGVDVLLRAFAGSFGRKDSVALVLKTFPNEHHDIARELEVLKRKTRGLPEIVLINRDLPPGQLIDLYHRCDALVAPSRGEGYGLPLAEAMALGLPVITTAYSGPLDFCDSETAWLVDYTFAAAQSHLGVPDSVWAEPDVADLSRALRQVFASTPEERRRVTHRARAVIERDHTWDRVAERLSDFLRELDAQRPPEQPHLGWLTPLDGNDPFAAELAKLLSRNIELRVPTPHAAAPGALARQIADAGCQAAVIHFDPTAATVSELGDLLHRLAAARIGSVVFLRSADEDLSTIGSALASAFRLVVHTIRDLNQLKDLGLVQNVALFPRQAATAATRVEGLLQALQNARPA